MKRIVALVLCIAMVFSLLPFGVLAEEGEPAEPTVTEQNAPAEEEKQEEEKQEEATPTPAPTAEPTPEPKEEEESTPTPEPEEEPTPEPEEETTPVPEPEEEGSVSITLKELKDAQVKDGAVEWEVKATCSSESTELSYQWQQLDASKEYEKKEDREKAWEDIKDETENKLAIEGIDDFSAYENLLFRCKVSCGDVAVYTEEVKLLPEQTEEIEEPKQEQPVSEEQTEEQPAEEQGEKTAEEQPAEQPVETEEQVESPMMLLGATRTIVASGTCGTNVQWELDDSGVLTISGTGAMKCYYKSTEGPQAPWIGYRYSIKQINIENGVTSIGSYAFINCSSASTITIPNSVISIGERAFTGCDFSSLVIPDSVIDIGEAAFSCSGILSIVLPANLKVLNASLFKQSTGLRSITIPSGVTTIYDSVFSESNISTIILPKSVNCILNKAFENAYATVKYEIGFKESLIDNYGGTITWQPITDGIIDYGTCGINLTWKLDDHGLLTIFGTGEMTDFTDGGAPWYSLRESVLKVEIADGVTRIGDDAFKYCRYLTSVTIPDSVTSIGKEAFEVCSRLTSITIPNSVTCIGPCAFANCGSLTNIIIPNGVMCIEDEAFCACGDLKNITIPDSVTSIGKSAFHGCDMIIIVIPNSVTSIGEQAFSECSNLTSVNIPDSVTSIGDSAFRGCSSLTSIAIPDSVTSIGKAAFSGCAGLTSITIPDNVTSIGRNAFSGCGGLKSITVGEGNTVYWSENNCIIRDTELILGCVTSVIPSSVTSIGGSAFFGCAGLKSITIPDSVTSIGGRAFFGCSSLTSITIPNGVTSIQDATFGYCTNLTSVIIPNSVINIEAFAFEDCSSLRNITIPNNVTILGYYAFQRCSSLTSITIPNSVTSIGDSAFRGCSSLTSVTIPSSVTSIGANAFNGVNATAFYEHGLSDNIVGCQYGGNLTWSEVLDKMELSSLPTKLSYTEKQDTLDVTGGKLTLYYWGEYSKDIDLTLAMCTGFDNTKAGKNTVTVTYEGFTTTFDVTIEHVPVTDPAVAPTYFTKGLTEGSHCSVCNAVLVEQKEIAETKLATPASPKAAVGATGMPEVTWGTAKDASGYEVYRSTNATSGYKKVATITSLKFVDTAVVVDTTYYYRIRGYIKNGDGTQTRYSGYTATVSAQAGPKAVTGVTVAVKSTTATVKWTQDTAVTGYEIYRATEKGGSYSLVKDITKNSAVSLSDSKRVPGTVCYYKVRAYQTVNGKKVYGPYSSVVTATVPLATPKLKAAKGGATSVKLSWGKITGAQSYVLYREVSGKWQKLTTATGTTYTLNVPPQGTYKFKLVAVSNASGVEVKSAEATASVTLTFATPSLSAKKTGATQITLSWKAIAGAEGYTVYQKINGTYKAIAKLTGTAYSLNVPPLGTYEFQVQAYSNAYGASVTTASSVARTVKLTFAAPKLTAKKTGATQITLSWKAIAGAEGYIVYQQINGAYKEIGKISSVTYSVTVAPKGSFAFQVKAYSNAYGASVTSAVSAARTVKLTFAAPSPTLKKTSATSTQLTWKAVAGATSYEVYRSTSANGTFTKVYSGSSLVFADTGLTKGTTYYYKIRAVCKQGSAVTYSDYSAAKNIKLS